MNDVKEVIIQLQNLDLKSTHINDIVDLFIQVGQTININVKIPPGSILLRARSNNTKHPRFTKVSQLSIKSEEYNTTFQRASTPYKTMFYGVWMSSPLSQDKIAIMRATGVYEITPQIRPTNASFKGKTTFGYWTVKKNLNAMAIMHNEVYATRNAYTKELVSAYEKQIGKCDTQIKKNSLLLYNFLAKEFSKEEIRDDYDYMISSVFSDAASRGDIDGIIYPSARAEGTCFNIAICESSMHKLVLKRVEETMPCHLVQKTIIFTTT
ncbi:MAG: hypothetical protein ACJAUD_001803 [Crocinitomicaceae bacterium]|jgi:hypothetical protein